MTQRQLARAFAARRCRCGAAAIAVCPGSEPIREGGMRLTAGRPDQCRCLRHIAAWPAQAVADRQRERVPA